MCFCLFPGFCRDGELLWAGAVGGDGGGDECVCRAEFDGDDYGDGWGAAVYVYAGCDRAGDQCFQEYFGGAAYGVGAGCVGRAGGVDPVDDRVYSEYFDHDDECDLRQ